MNTLRAHKKCLTCKNRNYILVPKILTNVFPFREIMVNVVPVRAIIKTYCYSLRKTLTFLYWFRLIRKKNYFEKELKMNVFLEGEILFILVCLFKNKN